MARKTGHQTQFHRSQIGRAQRYIRRHVSDPLTLTEIAREAGSSSYHFVRLFLAYTSETPFEFLRRLRLINALGMLQEDPTAAVTEIALSVGYETPSAFNKVFRKVLEMSPRDFRNLGKEAQAETIYLLSRPRLPKEIDVNLTNHYDVINRPATHYVFLEKHGPFAEVAPPCWSEMFPLLHSQVDQKEVTSFLGLSGIDKKKPGEQAMIYQAGVGLANAPKHLLKGLQYRKIESGNYARFVLTGPYSQIWMAFNEVFKTLAEAKVELRPEFCIENYVNDPKVTPEEELKTEILVPVV